MNTSDRPCLTKRMMRCALCLGLLFGLPALPPVALANPALDRQVSQQRLSAPDIARYEAIFALQADGDWPAANELISQLDNTILLGHVLAQRYLHPTAYRAHYRELAAWLDRYADHPEAREIYRLALKRKPRKAAAPHRPVLAEDSLAAELPLHIEHPYQSSKSLRWSERRKVQRLKRRIRRYVGRTWLTKAERLLQQDEVRRLFDRFELDDAYAQLAAGWLYYGKPAKAFEIANAAAERSGADIPTLHWTAGLAAWELNDTDEAARHFEHLASTEKASAWNRAAGAYWAARVHQQSPNAAESYRWLTVAARYPFTFYGLLARHRLNLHLDVDFTPAPPDPLLMGVLVSIAHGARAAALAEVGRLDLAEEELLALPDWKRLEITHALLAFTRTADLPRLGLEIARRLISDGRSRWTQRDLAAVMYPVPRWRPQGGFSVDRALIYAFIRQESSFDPRARSPDGARGLMQLMPRTASFLDRRRNFKGRTRKLLYDPGLNLALAQRYIERLLDNRHVAGDLLRLCVAYNAGPGNLRSWERKSRHGGDPLLFIETLPSLESRLFVERVMANLWIYRVRLGQAAPSLAALAADRWPTYESLDRPAPQIASDY